MNEDIQRIIEVANELLSDGVTAGSTSEQIAAAIILNDMIYLPSDYYNVFSASERLGEQWQGHVKQAQQHKRLLCQTRQ